MDANKRYIGMNYFYINTQTLEYPLFEGDIRLVYENIGDVFELPDDGVFARVDRELVPDADPDTQILVFNDPTFSDGKWTQTVTVQDLSEEEIALRKQMREEVLFKNFNNQTTVNKDEHETATTN